MLLGGSESTTAFAPLFEPIDVKHRMYAKKPTAVRLPTSLVPLPLCGRSVPDDAAVAQEVRPLDVAAGGDGSTRLVGSHLPGRPVNQWRVGTPLHLRSTDRD